MPESFDWDLSRGLRLPRCSSLGRLDLTSDRSSGGLIPQDDAPMGMLDAVGHHADRQHVPGGELGPPAALVHADGPQGRNAYTHPRGTCREACTLVSKSLSSLMDAG